MTYSEEMATHQKFHVVRPSFSETQRRRDTDCLIYPPGSVWQNVMGGSTDAARGGLCGLGGGVMGG